jgi:DNA-directed RNA polymerase subunit RPC12/RpoP
MPQQAAPWKCRACGHELGRVVDGVLRLVGRRVALDPTGLAMVVCPACKQSRLWKPNRVEAPTPVLN